jgi:tetratricopeptide (TPR) repeat protein
MLKTAAIAVAVIVLASATGAFADVQTECDNEDGAPDQAIIACSQVIKVDSRAAWAYFKRGNAYQAKGELDRAIADYGDAIALDPKFD